MKIMTVLLWSDATAAILITARFGADLFKGGVYFFGKPADIYDGWMKYI